MKTFMIASLLLSTALMAGMGRNMPSFSDFDANGDGKVTQKEFKSTQQKRMAEKTDMAKMMRNAGNASAFKDIDTDNNGKIDAKEFNAHQMMQKGKMGNMGKGMNNMGQGQNK